MTTDLSSWTRCLPRKAISALKEEPALLNHLSELRLRRGKPLCFCYGDKMISRKDHIITEEDMAEAWRLITASSVYALEEEVRRGYITLKGGHRVGIAGSAVLRDEKVKTQKDIASLNYRISREIIGAGLPLLSFITEGKRVFNTLIFSPPGAGKTTLLRDLTRLLSNGAEKLPPKNVSLIDERGEIAASYMGHPCFDVGDHTDVLHGFPKSEGMMLALRSLGPQVIVTDEIGTEEDQKAVSEAIRCGAALLLTAHGGSLAELRERPVLRDILKEGVFHRLVLMGQMPRPGTVEKIYLRVKREGGFDYVESDTFFSSRIGGGARGDDRCLRVKAAP